MKKLLLSWLCLVGASTLNAQVSGYTFASSSGTFNSIAATGTLVAGSDASIATTNDNAVWTVPLPFSFSFNGVGYASLNANSNGAVTFGTTTSTSSSVISASTAYEGAIGVMNRDLWGLFITGGVTTSGSNVITNVVSMQGIAVGKTLNPANGIPTGATITAFDAGAGTITMSAPASSSSATAVVRYGTGRIITSTEGTAPNRVFVVEYIGYNDYATTATTSNYLNFQLRLAESTNTVSIVYGPQYSISTTSRTNQIGLRGATNTDYNNRLGAVANPWTSTSAGTSNSSTVSRDNTNFPAAGLTFTWTPQTCFAPSGLITTGATSTSVSVSWGTITPAPSLGYEVYYSTTNTAPTAATVLDASNSVTSATSSATISGLTADSNYYVWVRSVCDATTRTAWTGSTTAVTGYCMPSSTNQLSWIADFSSTTATTNMAYTSAAGTAGGYKNATATDKISNYAGSITPISLTAGGPTVGIAVWVDWNNNLVFEASERVFVTSGYVTTTAGSIEVPTGTANGNYRMRAVVNYNSSAPNNPCDVFTRGEFVDYTFEVVAPPSCLAPTAPIAVSNSSSTGDISWTASTSAPALGYEIYYSTSATAPTPATPATVTGIAGTSTTLSGLSSATKYYVYVRANCSAADKSVWTIATEFTTLCAAFTVPYAENFDTTAVGTSTNNNAPLCWKYLEPASWPGYGYVSTTNSSSPNGYYIYSTDTTGGGMLVSPPTTNLMNGSNRIRFKASAGGNNYNMEVGTLSDPNDTATFAIIGSPIALTTSFVEYIVDIPAGTNQYIALRHPGQTVTGTSIRFDDIFVEVIPTCAAPTSLAVSNITETSADLSWTAPATAPANGYDVYFSNTNTPPTASTTPNFSGPLTTLALTGLTPSTQYCVWVRSNCSVTDQSTWEAIPCFNTLALPPANDDCGGAITLTVNPDQSCASVTSGNTLGATQSMAATPCGGTPDDDVWFKFVATATSHAISITNKVATGTVTTTSGVDMYFQVLSGACGTQTSMLCTDDDSKTVTGLTVGDTYYIRAYNYYGAGYNTSFDICVGTLPPPPANDDCANAIVVIPPTLGSPYTNTQDATSATNNGGFVACGTNSMNDGVWYTVVGDGGNYTIDITNVSGGFDSEIGVYTGSCGAFTCVGSKDSTGSNGNETFTFATATQTTYYINIGHWSGSTDGAEGPFTITISTDMVTAGTNDIVKDDKSFTIAPNPFTDVVRISDVKDVVSISIVDLSGRIVKTMKPAREINLGDLKTGMYLINLTYKDGSVKAVKAIKK